MLICKTSEKHLPAFYEKLQASTAGKSLARFMRELQARVPYPVRLYCARERPGRCARVQCPCSWW